VVDLDDVAEGDRRFAVSCLVDGHEATLTTDRESALSRTSRSRHDRCHGPGKCDMMGQEWPAIAAAATAGREGSPPPPLITRE
jgi:hypothetical protein